MATTITKDSAVTITYKVTTPQGKPLDAGHLSYLHGGYENIFPKVEAALDGQAVGFSTCLLYTSPSPRDKRQSRMPSSA